MNILLDTHILLWVLTEDDRLPAGVMEMTKNTGNSIFFSSISMWKIAIKRLVHPDKITDLTLQELIALSERSNMNELPLRSNHTYFLETLKRHDDAPPHKAPFDRILIAQAKAENMIFLTHDDTLTFYNEDCIMYV